MGKDLFLFCGLVALGFSAIAQEQSKQFPLPVGAGGPSGTPIAGAPVLTRSSTSSTMEDAARDLQSPAESERVGAAKLLGKYPGAQATHLLIGVLDDPSELVRRAAIVSLVEHINTGSFYSIGQPIYEKIFSKIGDVDVEVRRAVTALIPRLAFRLVQSFSQQTVINGRVVYRNTPGGLRSDLEALARKALEDPDAVVRQNMLKHHTILRIQILPNVLARLLDDNDKGVVLEAIDQARRYGSHSEIQQKFSALTKHPDAGVRSKLSRVSQMLSRSDSFYRSILRTLTDDPADEVATLAIIDLARVGEKVSPPMLLRIEEFLSQSKGFYGNAENLFFSLPVLGSKASGIYKALLDHPSSRMRAEAWAKFLLPVRASEDSSVWLNGLKDRDSEVREVILMTMRGRIQEATEADLQALLANKNAEVRSFGAELLLVADEELAKEQFFNFLIDENNLVRSTTLRVLARRKMDNWIMLHIRSLDDDEVQIQQAALDGLLSDSEEGTSALLEYVRKFPSHPISEAARRELLRKGIHP